MQNIPLSRILEVKRQGDNKDLIIGLIGAVGIGCAMPTYAFLFRCVHLVNCPWLVAERVASGVWEGIRIHVQLKKGVNPAYYLLSS